MNYTRSIPRSILVLVFAVSPGMTPCFAQEAMKPVQIDSAATSAPLTADERTRVVEGIAQGFEQRYLSPEIGARFAQGLRKALASGAYDGLENPEAFAQQLTADLQAVATDRHVRVVSEGPARPMMRRMGGAGPSALEEARLLTDDVAYLRFNLFPNDPAVAEAARAFLLANADVETVIIDARTIPGGGLLVMDTILPLLFGETSTLMRTDIREAVANEMGMPPPTLVPQEAPSGIARTDHVVTPDTSETRLQNARVLYLTSKKTASAAEHLALALKRTGRGTVIGETTAGAGNPGIPVPVGRFSVFVPFGRTYDPETGAGWEGTGVTPDVEVAANDALRKALELAGETPESARQLAGKVEISDLGG